MDYIVLRKYDIQLKIIIKHFSRRNRTMAAALQTTTVINVSQQVIKLLYSMIDVNSWTTTIPPNSAGELAVMPGTQVTIETSRLDPGQIKTFTTKGLITSVTY